MRGYGRLLCLAIMLLVTGLRGADQAPAAPAGLMIEQAVAGTYRVIADEERFWDCTGPAQLRAIPARAEVPATLLLDWGELPANGAVRLLLRESLALAGARCIEVWACQPMGDGDHLLQGLPLFRLVNGQEKAAGMIEAANTHIGPGTSRKAALWRKYRFVVPDGAQAFLGFSFTMRAHKATRGGSLLYLRGLAVDGLDYRNEVLYYVVGNYRDNFARVAFNGCGAREMCGSGGGMRPVVLLDNLLDPAKAGRPQEIRLALRVYDEEDRLVSFHQEPRVAARDTQDFLRGFALPLLAPGTYRVQGRSYHADTGEYFTTDWVQVIVIRSPQTRRTPVVTDPGLTINRALPFGRLEQTGPREIVFDLPAPGSSAPVLPQTLHYAVIPWAAWAPGRTARRTVEFTEQLPAQGQARLVAAYQPRRSAEIVVAELRDGAGRVLDREERCIGIANRGAEPPATATRLAEQAQIPPLWVNTILMDIEGQLPGKTPEYIRKNAAALRAVGANTGLYPSLEAMEPLPGVYNREYLAEILDAGRDANCPVLLYLSEKWPPSWAPVEFYLAPDGTVSGEHFVWTHMCGAYNYAAGPLAVERIRRLNTETARVFGNHPGLAALYFENEHLISGADNALASSCAPQNIAAYRAYLRTRYPSLQTLNTTYSRTYANFDEVLYPPLAREGISARAAEDWRTYLQASAEGFMLERQVLAARAVAPALALIVYSNMLETPASQAFYLRLRDAGAMLANGGVHADLAQVLYREAVGAVSGLRERMEPHLMWTYEPIPFGLEDMLYGMLALGGRGLNFQAFVRIIPWEPDYTPQRLLSATGFDRVRSKWPVLEELSRTEKLHDRIGILALHAPDAAGKSFNKGVSRYDPGLFPFALGMMAQERRNPKILFAPGNAQYLNDSHLVFVVGGEIAADDATWLEGFVQSGAAVVLCPGAAIQREGGDPYDLAVRCGALPAAGEEMRGLPGEAYRVGKGKIYRLGKMPQKSDWTTLATTVLSALAGETPESLFACSTDGVKAQVLHDAQAHYLVVMYHPQDRHWRAKSEERVSPSLCVRLPLDAKQYVLCEIWEGGEKRIVTREELAKGFPAGDFRSGQMKIFRIRAE